MPTSAKTVLPIDLEATIVGSQYSTPNVQWQQSFDAGISWSNIPGATNTVYTHTNLSGGDYYYRYLLANDPSNLLNSKCRVVSNVKIVHVVPKFYNLKDTLCQGLTFPFGNKLYSQSGTYVDSLQTSIGCDSIVTLELTILPDEGIVPVLVIHSPSCAYLQDGSITTDTVFNATAPYSILVNGATLPGNGAIGGLSEGNYTYLLTDRYGCHFDTILLLQTPNPFVIDLGPDQPIDMGETIQLNPYHSLPIGNYLWEPASLFDCSPNCEKPHITPPNSTFVALVATSIYGCVSSDSMYVDVNNIRKVYIPNAFSPNLDGINDRFTIYSAAANVQQIEQLQVFDRWGGLVFERRNFLPNDEKDGWDGSAEGKTLDSGVYIYVANIRFLNGENAYYSGDLTLFK